MKYNLKMIINVKIALQPKVNNKVILGFFYHNISNLSDHFIQQQNNEKLTSYLVYVIQSWFTIAS